MAGTGPAAAGTRGASRNMRRSRLRGRSTRARKTEPRYSTMKPTTATTHRCGPGPVEASDEVDGAAGAAAVVGVAAAVVGVAAPDADVAITGDAGALVGAAETMPVAAALLG